MPPSVPPSVIVIGGPNGAGKTTLAPALVNHHLRLGLYVNADAIARGLAGFDPDAAAIQAGRLMLMPARRDRGPRAGPCGLGRHGASSS
ncbi:MAG: hypothetical protein AB7N76_08840 [Planctomycetota bacterium]